MPLCKTSDEVPEKLQGWSGLPGGTLAWAVVLTVTKIERSLCLGSIYTACFGSQGWAAHLQLKGWTDSMEEGAWH